MTLFPARGPEPVFRDGLFNGEVVLVSGGGSGLGRAIAVQFAALGASVAICGRRIERLEETAELIRKNGGTVSTHAMSIRDPEAVVQLVIDVANKHGRIDHLVNNAGGQFPQAAIDFSIKGWNAVIDTNLNGSWYMMQAVARHWRDQQLGIRINCVAPGAIATGGMEVYSEEARRELPRSNLMQRFGSAQDVADAVTYLAAPSGRFITGEVLTVDGGNQLWGDQWTIPRPGYFGGPAG
jgi:citronellol/citronellal dehydrogenase